ncbi:MAG: Xaa-Pro peptidase family protein [Terriglobales bacterium]|jgi:Xaa-Pro aminopeptidase
MTDTPFARLENLLASNPVDGIMLTSVASLTYFAGYEGQIEWGSEPWLPCPGALLWMRGETPLVFLPEGANYAAADSRIDRIAFTSYVYQEPLPGIQSLIKAIKDALKPRISTVSAVTIGAELAYLPSALLISLIEACPHIQFADISSNLAEVRAIKTPAELQRLRQAVLLCDCGQRAAKEIACAGMTEIELYSRIHAAMESEAGCRVPVLADVLSGPRTAEVGGPPSSRVLCKHDLVLVDLVPRLEGYWGDSCNTFAVGAPSEPQRTLFQTVQNTLQGAIEQVRPGLSVSELDRFVREKVTHAGVNFPHHTGHGLGVTWHEEPRIVPYSSTVLREGMVIALEPGMYFEGQQGLRLESVVAVTSNGAEVLTEFVHTL